MIDDIKRPQQNDQPSNEAPKQPVQDDITQPADELAKKLQSASTGVGDLAKNMDTVIERKLDSAEQKIDTFMKNLDNFLGKF